MPPFFGIIRCGHECFLKEELKGEAEAEVVVAEVRRVADPERHTTVHGNDEPTATTAHAGRARRRSFGIGLR